MSWYLGVLKNYAVFTGRARRKEYWMFFLFNFIFAFILAGIDSAAGAGGGIRGFYYLAVFLPSLAVTVRRLHDVGKSGWFILISFIPFIGGIWLLILMCTEGNSGVNRYGENPKEDRTEIETQAFPPPQYNAQKENIETESVVCPGCGATNVRQIGKKNNCEYCGSPI